MLTYVLPRLMSKEYSTIEPSRPQERITSCQITLLPVLRHQAGIAHKESTCSLTRRNMPPGRSACIMMCSSLSSLASSTWPYSKMMVGSEKSSTMLPRSSTARQHKINQRIARQRHLLAQPDRHRLAKERPIAHKRVIFAALAAEINLRSGKFSDQRLAQRLAQPGFFRSRQFRTRHNRVITALNHFACQGVNRFAPNRFQVQQALRCRALFVPGAHIGQMNVAKDDRVHAALAQFCQRAQKDRLEIVWLRGIAQQRNAQRIGLCLNQGLAHAMKAHALAGPVVEVDQIAHRPAAPDSPVQREHRVFAATETERARCWLALHHLLPDSYGTHSL